MGKANPKRMNGVNVQLNALLNYQNQIGLDVEFWGLTPKPVANVNPHAFSFTYFKFSKLRFLIDRSLISKLRKLEKPTIIHFHGGFFPEFFLVHLFLRVYGIPWVISSYGAYASEFRKQNFIVKFLFFWLFDYFLIRDAHAVFVQSVEHEQILFKVRRDKPVVETYNVLDADSLKFTKIAHQDTRVFRVGFCGRLVDKVKGIGAAIEGFDIFSNSQKNTSLLIIGEGPDENWLKELCDFLQNDKVQFLGALHGEEKLKTMSGFDVLLCTSRWDSKPVVVVEAAHLGKPVIVTEQTQYGNLVAGYDCGFVLKKSDPTEIAAALEDLYLIWRSNSLGRLSRSAKKMARENFSVGSLHETIAVHYQN